MNFHLNCSNCGKVDKSLMKASWREFIQSYTHVVSSLYIGCPNGCKKLCKVVFDENWWTKCLGCGDCRLYKSKLEAETVALNHKQICKSEVRVTNRNPINSDKLMVGLYFDKWSNADALVFRNGKIETLYNEEAREELMSKASNAPMDEFGCRLESVQAYF